MASKKSKDYSIGYGRPPTAGQFKPGESGNPNGRPKGSPNFATALRKELDAPIEIVEKGMRKTITRRHAIAKQAVNKAVLGDLKAISFTVAEDRSLQHQVDLHAAEEALKQPEEQQIIAQILARVRHFDQAPLETGSGESLPSNPPANGEKHEA